MTSRAITVLGIWALAATAVAQPAEEGGEGDSAAPVVGDGEVPSGDAVEPVVSDDPPVFVPVHSGGTVERMPGGVSGEDEGGRVPSAPAEGDREPTVVQGRPVAVVPAGPEPAGDAAWLAGVPEGSPTWEFRRGEFALAPVGLLQVLGVPWQGEGGRMATGSPVDEVGFRFRRVRLGVKGELPWNFSFELVGQFAADGARLLDALLTYRLDEAFEVSVGSGKPPFSASQLTPAAFLTFLDRPWGVDGQMAEGQRVGIAPDRQIGLWMGGAWNMLRYRVGISNGNTDWFAGNNNAGMLYAARVELHPLGDLPEGQLAVAEGAPLLRVGASYYFNDDAAGDYHAAEGDVKFRWLGLTVEGEFLWSRFLVDGDPERPEGYPSDVTRLGYYAQVGYLVVPEWLELAVRFDGFELDDGVADFNDRWSLGGVATLFLLHNRVKVQLEYAHVQEWDDPQIPNDTVVLQLQGRL